jgi:RimJ/RimL family protein N-acetyltransferase
MSRFAIKKLTPDEWAELSEAAHHVVFEEKRSWDMDRIDYALICEEGGVPCGYLTARELDKESVYWQYGGAFPGTHSSSRAVAVYEALIDWTLERYQRITTLVENENVRYLKLALHAGFRIIGCRFFNGIILVELLRERGGNLK